MVGLQCSDKSREAILRLSTVEGLASIPCKVTSAGWARGGSGIWTLDAPTWHPLTPPNSESNQASRLKEPIGYLTGNPGVEHIK